MTEIIEDNSLKTHSPRPEYPRPQMQRDEWLNLNGTWDFEIINDNSQPTESLKTGVGYTKKITVPFCPESELSRIKQTAFMKCVWYAKKFTIPETWIDKRVIVNFGAVDYRATVWCNGTLLGSHHGGYTPFSFEITSYLIQGENTITLQADEDTESPIQPSGKQAMTLESQGCFYTRITGIWQTVWLEAIPQTYIKAFKFYPEPRQNKLTIVSQIDGDTEYTYLRATVFADGNPVGSTIVSAHTPAIFTIDLSEKRLWSPEHPFLYDVELTLEREYKAIDTVKSYFGMRTIRIRGNQVLLNDTSYFQRLVLDQGYYPDGLYTAPTDEALKKDIELGKAMGFNGARLHQKIFEPRYLYWADKLGYLVWSEYPNWGLDYANPWVLEKVLPEWNESIERDFNHPSIVGWAPFNETTENQNSELIRNIVRTTKLIDPTRPVIDASGWVHVETDIHDTHDYEQIPSEFAKHYEEFKSSDLVWENLNRVLVPIGCKPFMVSEYGGIWWNPHQNLADTKSWGYGVAPQTEEEFLIRYKGLTEALLFHPKIFGLCYTQLYDVEQEVNGLYTYDRKPKFDPEFIRRINQQKAAIEMQ